VGYAAGPFPKRLKEGPRLPCKQHWSLMSTPQFLHGAVCREGARTVAAPSPWGPPLMVSKCLTPGDRGGVGARVALLHDTNNPATLSVELAERIRRFWHERMLDRESEAYELLLKRGLEAIEREDQGKRRRIRKEDE
jgi:hypothetical protein